MTTLVLGSYVHAHLLQVVTLPDTGQSVLAKRYWSEHGGKGLNVGVGLQRLNEDMRLLLPVGDDHAGQQITADLQRMNIDTRWVIRCGSQSGYGMGLVDSLGNNVIAVYPGANALLESQIVCEAVKQCRPHSLYAQLEIPLPTIMAAFGLARQQGIRTLLNPSPWQPLTAELLSLTQVMMVNATEAAGLFNCHRERLPQSPQAWLHALPALSAGIAWQGDWLIVTLGNQGCVAMGRDELLYQPGWPIVAVDATGAGDAFNAGLMWALQRETPEQALRIANACGAYIAARNGVLAHLPDPQKLQAFMRKQPPPQGHRLKRAF